jgi:hypothetical protein
MQDSLPTILPPRRVLTKRAVRWVSPDGGPAEEDRPIPATLDDGPGLSLAVQLGLGRLSVRAAFCELFITTRAGVLLGRSSLRIIQIMYKTSDRILSKAIWFIANSRKPRNQAPQ